MIVELPNKTKAILATLAPLEGFNAQIALSVALGSFYQSRAAAGRRDYPHQRDATEIELNAVCNLASWLLKCRAAKLRFQNMIAASDAPRAAEL